MPVAVRRGNESHPKVENRESFGDRSSMTDQVRNLLTQLRAVTNQQTALTAQLAQLGLDTPDKLQEAMIELIDGE